MSKKKRKLENRLKIAALKQLCPRPEVVEVWDVTAPDPGLLVYLKVRSALHAGPALACTLQAQAPGGTSLCRPTVAQDAAHPVLPSAQGVAGSLLPAGTRPGLTAHMPCRLTATQCPCHGTGHRSASSCKASGVLRSPHSSCQTSLRRLAYRRCGRPTRTR